MLIVKCDKCKKILEVLPKDPRAGYDWLQYWLKSDNHLCNPCWVKQFHVNPQKQIENKHPRMAEIDPWPYDDYQNPDNWGRA